MSKFFQELNISIVARKNLFIVALVARKTLFIIIAIYSLNFILLAIITRFLKLCISFQTIKKSLSKFFQELNISLVARKTLFIVMYILNNQ